MPRYARIENPTPFAQLLLDYMWGQRPPLSIGQLAIKLGVARGTVYNWVYRHQVPTPQFLSSIAERLGIPLARLYEAAGIEIPPPQPPAPPQARQDEQPALPPDASVLWEAFIARVIRSMRTLQAQGRFSDEDVAAVVSEVRSQQLGVDLSGAAVQPEATEQAQDHISKQHHQEFAAKDTKEREE